MGVDTKIAPQSLNFEIKSAPLTKLCQFETNCKGIAVSGVHSYSKDSQVENVNWSFPWFSKILKVLGFENISPTLKSKVYH